MPHRHSLNKPMLRLAAVAALAVAALAATASPSLAGTYQVVSCNGATSKANNAWVPSTTTSTVTTSQTCPSSGTYSGLLVTPVNGQAGTPGGEGALWTFDAPSGTTITAISYDRYTGLNNGDGWNPRLRLSDGTEYDSCTIAYGDLGCSVGSGPAGTGGQITRIGLSATSMTWGLLCLGPGTCADGATQVRGWAALYGSTVTISDPVPPAIGAASGALTSPSGYRRGLVSGTLSATDTTGIAKTAVYVDGTRYDVADRSCDFTYVVPCSALSSGTVTLNSAQFLDGTHNVQLAAADAGGEWSQSPMVAMVFDNTAPAAPTGLTVSSGASSTTNSFNVSWTNPAGPQVSPLTSVHYRIGAGAAQTVPLTTSLTGLQVPAGGFYPLSVWLEDEAGNASAANAASTTLTYVAPDPPSGGGGGGGGGSKPTTPEPAPSVPEPAPSPAPVVPVVTPQPSSPVVPPRAVLSLGKPSLSRGLLRLSGRVANVRSGRVTVTYTARVHGRKRSQKTTARVSKGRYRVRLRLRGALARTKRGTVTIAYPGSSSVRASRAHKTVAAR